MTVRAFLPSKEHPELPDAYGMKIFLVGERDPLELEVSEHRIIDKIYQQNRNEQNGAVTFQLVGVAPIPLLEYTTKEDVFETIPLINIRRICFDKRWSQIRAIYTEMEKKGK